MYACVCVSCVQGVVQLCQMLRYTATLNTLRVDVSSREGAEAIARELPNNRSLMHLTIGGPVPEALLAQVCTLACKHTHTHRHTQAYTGTHRHRLTKCRCADMRTRARAQGSKGREQGRR